jgi:DNA-binding GntR family transcriptional regulator
MASLSAREQAYQTIRSRIITMELKPGDPLNDRELAEQMGISRTPMREALIMLNIAHMVDIKPQSGTHVAPIDLKRMELEQFARFTLEKEILNRVRGRLTDQQEQEYRQIIENYRLLEANQTQPNRETRLLELDNAFHRRAFELCGMEHHFDHMLASLQHVERIRKFSLQTNENKAVCAAHTRILDAMVQNDTQELSRALESHLSRYKQTVEEVQRLHPDYFTDGLEP